MAQPSDPRTDRAIVSRAIEIPQTRQVRIPKHASESSPKTVVEIPHNRQRDNLPPR